MTAQDALTRFPRADAHQTLRSGTADLHKRLDDLLTAEEVITTPAGYHRLLWLMAFARHRYSVQLARATNAAGLTDHSRTIRAALAADLNALSSDFRTAQTEVVDGADDGVAADAGILYVFEGAALGARQIRRRLMAATPHASFPMRYFDHLAVLPAIRWRQVLLYLDRCEAPLSSMVRSAQACFGFLIRQIECYPGFMAEDGR